MRKVYRAGIVGLTGIGAGVPGKPLDAALPHPMPISHAGAYAACEKTKVVAVCDLVEDLCQRFVENWGAIFDDVRTYTDYRKMLENEKLDIISVVTSDHRHADIVVDAAKAGVKGIFCEKPIATTLEDADRMIEAVEKSGAVMSVNHTRRWYPLYHRVRQLVREGAVGKLHRIICVLGGPRAMLFRNGTHLIDAICFFAESEPEWVFAELDEGFEDYFEYRGDGGHDPATDPGACGYIHFKNGVRALYLGSKGTPAGSYLELVGAEGRIRVSDDEAHLAAVDHQTRQLATRPVRHLQWMKSGIAAAVDELVHLMEEGGESVSPPREARKTLEIIIAMLKSQERGNVRVNLPLA